MPARAVQLAKRTLVSLLRSLGRAYGVPLTVTRDSADAAVNAAYRRIVLKVHPDKGGRGRQRRAAGRGLSPQLTRRVRWGPRRGKSVPESALRRLKFDMFRVKRPAAAPRARNTGADLTQSHGAEGRRAGAPRHWSRENKCAAEATAQRPVTTGHLGGWGKEYTEQPATK